MAYTASIGDPKIVLASSRSSGSKKPRKKAESTQKKGTLLFQLQENMEIAQLTVDQFVTSTHEVGSFRNANVLRKFKDSFGTEIGPYRLFIPNQPFPGIKVARTLGDFGLKQFGLKDTPIIQEIVIYPKRDQFLILATDGVWSMLDNSEAVAFVEKYRKHCQSISDNENDIDTKSQSSTRNSTICRLLCEEARNRWLEVIRTDAVDSDDIAAVVIQFNQENRSKASGSPNETSELQPSLSDVGDEPKEEQRRISKAFQVSYIPGSTAVNCPPNFDGRRRSMITLEGANYVLRSCRSFLETNHSLQPSIIHVSNTVSRSRQNRLGSGISISQRLVTLSQVDSVTRSGSHSGSHRMGRGESSSFSSRDSKHSGT